jgi:hypothetical protein
VQTGLGVQYTPDFAPKDAIQARIVDSIDHSNLLISLTRRGLKKKVVIDSIMIERAFAEAIQARPPVGFKEEDLHFPDENTFEGDLTTLTDGINFEEITEADIQQEIKKQFKEEQKVAIEFSKRMIVWRGPMVVPPEKDVTVSIPTVSNDNASGEIIFTYKYRGGLWSPISASCSVNCQNNWTGNV